MKKQDKSFITIKKSHVFYTIIAIALFLLGIFVGNFILLREKDSKIIENCRKFCEFIPDTEFSHIGTDNHCYCLQKNQKLYDSKLNKTLIYTRIVDAGIVTDVVIKNYIE